MHNRAMLDSEYLHLAITADVDAALSIEGDLPADLHGTFLAIGGTGTRVGETALHGFDAHGRVTAIAIGAGQARLKARMIDTPLRREELARGVLVKRRLFHNKPKRWSNLFDIDLGNPVSHNVVRWGDSVVAMNDPGFFALDPETLATRGPTPLAPKKGATFLPMPRRDPRTGHMVLAEHRPGLRDTVIVREVRDDFTIASEHAYKLPRGAALFHDIAFTERFYLVVQWGALSLGKALWGAMPISGALRFDPATTPVVHLLPRAGGVPITLPLPGGRLSFHFWNAFEDGPAVVLDAIGYDGQVSFNFLYPPEARVALGVTAAPTPAIATVRYTIDPVARSAREEVLTTLPVEAPDIHPARRGLPYRYAYAPTLGAGGDERDPNGYPWFHALARHDLDGRRADVWDAGARAFVSPPAFVPRPGGGDEADGWVLALVQDVAANASALAVFSAADIARGPIARLHAPASVGLLGMISHVSFSA